MSAAHDHGRQRPTKGPAKALPTRLTEESVCGPVSRPGARQRAALLDAIVSHALSGGDGPKPQEVAHAEIVMALDVVSGITGYRRVRVAQTEEGAGYERARTEQVRARIENEGRLLALLWAWELLEAHRDHCGAAVDALEHAIGEWYLRGPLPELPRGHAERERFVRRVLE